MRFFANMEKIIKDQSDIALEQLLFYTGVDLLLYRQDNDKYSDAFGKFSGNKSDLVKRFVGALVSDDFFPADGAAAGNFEEGFLYTKETDIKVTDVIEVDSSDGKVRRYKVDSYESIGTQDSVFSRWKITNLVGK
jgi:hypothetical protein